MPSEIDFKRHLAAIRQGFSMGHCICRIGRSWSVSAHFSQSCQGGAFGGDFGDCRGSVSLDKRF